MNMKHVKHDCNVTIKYCSVTYASCIVYNDSELDLKIYLITISSFLPNRTQYTEELEEREGLRKNRSES